MRLPFRKSQHILTFEFTLLDRVPDVGSLDRQEGAQLTLQSDLEFALIKRPGWVQNHRETVGKGVVRHKKRNCALIVPWSRQRRI